MIGDLRTRLLSVGASSVEIAVPSAEVLQTVHDVFVDLADGDSSAPVERGSISAPDDSPGAGWLSVNLGIRAYAPQPLSAAMASMVTSVSRMALDADPARLHLHCAALQRGETGVLVVAASGTGKTLLAMSMAQHGWAYGSDEAIAIEPDGDRVQTFPKPMVVKERGGGLVPQAERARVPLGDDDGLWWIVPARSLGASCTTRIDPRCIVLLRRPDDGDLTRPPRIDRLHPADAVVSLMSQTMDAARFGADAVVMLSRLASRCVCVSMTVGPLEDAVAAVETVSSAQHQATPVEVMQDRSADASLGWRPAGSVVSVVIGSRVVAHDSAGGAIVAFDEAGSGLWQALHGAPPAWWSPDILDLAGTKVLLEQLSGAGFLEPLSRSDVSG